MAWTYVAEASQSSTAALTTGSFSMTAGVQYLVLVERVSGSSNTSSTLTGTNISSQFDFNQSNTYMGGHMFIASSTTTGTVTATFGSSQSQIRIYVFSTGLSGSSAYVSGSAGNYGGTGAGVASAFTVSVPYPSKPYGTQRFVIASTFSAVTTNYPTSGFSNVLFTTATSNRIGILTQTSNIDSTVGSGTATVTTGTTSTTYYCAFNLYLPQSDLTKAFAPVSSSAFTPRLQQVMPIVMDPSSTAYTGRVPKVSEKVLQPLGASTYTGGTYKMVDGFNAPAASVAYTPQSEIVSERVLQPLSTSTRTAVLPTYNERIYGPLATAIFSGSAPFIGEMVDFDTVGFDYTPLLDKVNEAISAPSSSISHTPLSIFIDEVIHSLASSVAFSEQEPKVIGTVNPDAFALSFDGLSPLINESVLASAAAVAHSTYAPWINETVLADAGSLEHTALLQVLVEKHWVFLPAGQVQFSPQVHSVWEQVSAPASSQSYSLYVAQINEKMAIPSALLSVSSMVPNANEWVLQAAANVAHSPIFDNIHEGVSIPVSSVEFTDITPGIHEGVFLLYTIGFQHDAVGGININEAVGPFASSVEFDGTAPQIDEKVLMGYEGVEFDASIAEPVFEDYRWGIQTIIKDNASKVRYLWIVRPQRRVEIPPGL